MTAAASRAFDPRLRERDLVEALGHQVGAATFEAVRRGVAAWLLEHAP